MAVSSTSFTMLSHLQRLIICTCCFVCGIDFDKMIFQAVTTPPVCMAARVTTPKMLMPTFANVHLVIPELPVR